MFKDYYLILGVKQDASFEAIRAAYELKSKGWHPERHPDCDVTNKLLDVNEAYVILKDAAKRQRYDKEYVRYRVLNDAWRTEEYVMQDEMLQEDIKQARQAAHALVSEFMLSYYKKASRKARPGCGTTVFYFLIVTIFLAVIKLALETWYEDKANVVQHSEVASEPTSQTVDVSSSSAPWQTPASWRRYEFGNGACSIAFPGTVELYETYTPEELGVSSLEDQFRNKTDGELAVFLCKGLADESYDDYCCATIVYVAGRSGDYLKTYETEDLDRAARSALRELVVEHLGAYRLLSEPTYRWIDIQGIKALEIKYRKSGEKDGSVAVAQYLLNNYSKLFRIEVACREQDKSSWSSDWNNVIRTFRWE